MDDQQHQVKLSHPYMSPVDLIEDARSAADARARLDNAYPAAMHAVDNVGGVLRYRRNRIIDDLVTAANAGKVGLDLNQVTIKVARGEYTEAERAELYRLIGYSLSGFDDVFAG